MQPFFYATAIILLVAIQQLVQVSGHTLLTESIGNALHIPLFAAITVLLARLRPRWSLATILGIVVLIAMLTELLQLGSTRRASWADFGLDLLGCAWGAWYLNRRPTVPISLMLLVLVATTLAHPTWEGIKLGAQHLWFPTLFDPDRWLWRHRIHSRAQLHYAPATDWPLYANNAALHIRWNDQRFPNIRLVEPVSDWSQFTVLCIDLFNPQSVTQPVTLGVMHRHDGRNNVKVHRMLAPGYTRARFSVKQLAFDANDEPAPIYGWSVLTQRSERGNKLLLGRAWLQTVENNCTDEP